MTIQAAVNAAAPGSVVTIPAGTYNEGVIIGKPLTLRAAGLVNIRAPEGMAGIRIGANDVTVEGPFDIVAPRDDGIEGNDVMRATVRGVTCHDCGESGIQFNWSEWITIERCIVYKNARLSWYSGISVYQCRNLSGDKTTPGPRTIIRGNICHDNWTFAGAATDGNGIIVDDNNSTQDSAFPAWRFPTLVENNLCYRNGGKGIAVAWSDFTTVRRNTCVGNNGDPRNDATWRGDISVQSSRDCIVEDNIAVVDPTTHPSSTALGAYGGENARNVWRGNFAFGGPLVKREPTANNPIPATANRLGVDPQLVMYVPNNPAAAAAGWRPANAGAVPPKEPTVMAIAALLAALDATMKNVETRLAALEGRAGGDPAALARIAAVEDKIGELQYFAQRIKDLG
jgi:parallel beta-helix repeat protein